MTTSATELLGQPWAILEDRVQDMLAITLRAERGESVDDLRAAFGSASPSARRTGGGTTRIFIRGLITQRASFFSGSSTAQISAELAYALADDQTSQIILEIDSPGGTVPGVPELAAEIYAARAKKPITAVVDTMAASAAYWLASQASEIVVAPSGAVGSIGVFGLHIDSSRALDAAGLTPTFIQAGKYKTEANPLQPLSDDAKAAWQARVDAAYAMFVHDVARGRGVSETTVRDTYGEGRMVLPQDALAKRMIDRIGGAAVSIGGAAPALSAAAVLHDAHARASRIRTELANPAREAVIDAKAMLARVQATLKRFEGQDVYGFVNDGDVSAGTRRRVRVARTLLCTKLGLDTQPKVEWFLPEAKAAEHGLQLRGVFPWDPSKDVRGFTSRDGSVVLRADEYGPEIVESLAHELVHYAEPLMSETDVRSMARYLSDEISPKVNAEVARLEAAADPPRAIGSYVTAVRS